MGSYMKLEELKGQFRRVRRVRDNIDSYTQNDLKRIATNILLTTENIYTGYKKELLPKSYKNVYKLIQNEDNIQKLIEHTTYLLDTFLELESFIMRRRT